MVALGTLLSTFWILSANSWMQTPVGHAIVDGRFVPDDWYRIVFNPSFPYRLVHTTIAFFITTAFVVIGVAAYHLRRERHVEESLVMQKMGIGLLAVLVPLQVVVGDLHGIIRSSTSRRRSPPSKRIGGRSHACRCSCSHGPTNKRSATDGNSVCLCWARSSSHTMWTVRCAA